ncbi:UV radiation resistance-associated gene protein-like, partial [Clupea harengus]|uniref:UV radiation resistance-associated gene protein-like n=1 Tax=Clupea harengus TaxID=7950 RepID=A0A8M1KFL9_CLUHA
LRYQHGLSTPDLRQTLPNLKNFMEHGLLVRCDWYQGSSSLPVPIKSQLSVSAASDMPSPPHMGSPERVLRKRASSEADKPTQQTPPPSYSTAMAQPASPIPLTVSSSEEPDQDISPSQEPAVDLVETPEVQTTTTPPAESEPEPAELERSRSQSESAASDSTVATATAHQHQGDMAPEETEVSQQPQHQGAMNGSALLGDGLAVAPVAAAAPVTVMGAEVCCSVERAEEIMGTEALGMGMSMGLGAGGRMLEVEHAVAVECDDQVLGELDTAGLEEFSRRIYALNENMPSFRRPRKGSDK